MEVENVYYLSDFGNPGTEYEKTRHNVGFKAIDKIAENFKISMSKNKFDAIIGEGFCGTEKVILVKPQTYMNLSGTSIKQIVDFYKLDLSNLIVIYDDIDIPLGKIKIKPSGSSGTHNGMRNIVAMLSSEEFTRIRIGTDKPKFNMNLADYVLMNMTKEEEQVLEPAIINASKAVERIINTNVQSAMNEFNGI